MWKLFCKSVKPPIAPRGLYSPPVAGEMYSSHMEWAGCQRPTTVGFMALSLAAVNESIHHCRIGKITLKQPDKAV